MTFKGVLFDFSGTLFRIESAGSWLRAVLDESGIAVPPDEVRRYAMRLAVAGALPGGSAPQQVPAALAGLWATRDASAERAPGRVHRSGPQVELPDPALYDALYDTAHDAGGLATVPDAAEVLTAPAAWWYRASPW